MNNLPVIRFSHKYLKLNALGDEPTAKLLEVLNVNLADLHDPFILSDTIYFETPKDESEGKGKFYYLPKEGDYLLLIFAGESIFTTIRRRTPEKERYYRSHIGGQFFVEITGGKYRQKT